jgi:hypothetical protein
VVALSWRHNAINVTPADLVAVSRLDANNPRRAGFVVAFGERLTDNPASLRRVRFAPGTIDDNTFEMYFVEPVPSGNPPSEFYARVPRATPRGPFSDLIPVDIQRLDTSGLVTAATEVAVGRTGEAFANGAAIVVDPLFFETLRGRRVFVQLRTNFMVDDASRAVDGDFIHGTLPTGDQIAGGTFWSWVRLR